MRRGPSGRIETEPSLGGESVRAFVPHPLPPDPPLLIDGRLRERLDHALLALGRLDSISTLLPDTRLFLSMYIRKEAVLSSQIEGTRSSLSDLLLFEVAEAPGVPVDDVQEVSSYVRALERGLALLAGGLPLSNRLLREVHGILLAEGRGASKSPGEFRTSQNWIGGTRPGNAAFVPPPPALVPECMASLERFLHHRPERTPVLLEAALAHVQFETIHPFLDGNGRVGRLLITLILCAEGVLKDPMLYLSLHLRSHRDEYFRLLQQVREEGDWEAWIEFFVRGVEDTAKGSVETARRIVALFAEDRVRVQGLGRAAGSALRVHHELQRQPILSVQKVAERTGLAIPTVQGSLRHLEALGIVRELTGRLRGRLYGYEKYIAVLSEGVGTG